MMSHGKRFESAAEIALAYHLECMDTCRVLFENSAEFLGLDLGLENYRRQPRASTDTDQSHTLIQHAENEILISNSGKINRYVTVGLELLEKNKSVVVIGSGKAVSKTVSVAEILKRRMDGALHQYTQIGSSASTEKWDPVEGKEFDQLIVSKHIPVLTIYLCREASPALEKVSGYQPPTKEVGKSE